MIKQFILGYISCVGFGMIFNNKIKSTLIGSVAGAFGWLAYILINDLSDNTVFATFVGALTLGVICEIFARKFKDAAVVFLVPAILPLVPGGGLYLTLRYLLNYDLSLALSKGLDTLGCATAIAIGLLFTTAISKLITKIKF